MIARSFRLHRALAAWALAAAFAAPAAAADPPLTVTSKAGRGGGLRSAVADLRVLPPLESTECPKTEPSAGRGATVPSLAEAIGRLQRHLAETERPEALRALAASPEARDPARASELAVLALADRRPGAALGLLLSAHRAAPGDPTHLVNLAGLATSLGRPAEGLALVRAAAALGAVPAAPEGIDGRAVLANNEGDALLVLGRPGEAEASFRRSLELQPDLAEGSTGLAFALGDQGKCKEAVKALRRGAFRRPPKDPRAVRAPLGDVLDLGRGRPGALPVVPIPRTPEEAAANAPAAVERGMAALAGQGAGPDEGTAREASDARIAEWKRAGLSGRLTAERATLLRGAVQDFTRLGPMQQPLDPVVDPLNAEYVDALEALRAKARKADREASADSALVMKGAAARQNACGDDPCRRAVDAAAHRAICDVARGYVSKVQPAAHEYDRALRAYFRESYLRASAAGATLGDPAHQDWVRARLATYQQTASGELLEELSVTYAGPAAQLGQSCEAESKGAAFGDEKSGFPEACKALQGLKAQVSVGVMDVSVSCEEIEVGVSTPGFIGLFGQVNYSMGSGKTTVFAGGVAGAKAMGAGVQGKAGGYLVFDSRGNLNDAGMKATASASASLHLGPVSVGREVDLGTAQVSFLSSRTGSW